MAAILLLASHVSTEPRPRAASLTLTLTPSSVVGGNSVAGVIVLGAAAPTGGIAVTLRSSNLAVAGINAPSLGPSSAVASLQVIVPAGQTSFPFQVRTLGVAAPSQVTISAATSAEGFSLHLPVNPASIQDLLLPRGDAVGGATIAGSITLDGAAPLGTGATIAVSLSEQNTTRTSTPVASVPATVSVRPGARTATLTISTVPTAIRRTYTVTASLGLARTASIAVAPPSLTDFRVLPNRVVAGTAAIGSVTLNGVAPPEGHAILLESAHPSVVVPAQISVSSGTSEGRFAIGTLQVPASVQATVSASEANAATGSTIADGTSNTLLIAGKTATLAVTPLQVTSLEIGSPPASSAAVFGGEAVSATVALNGPAPAGGQLISLTPSRSDVITGPATVSVPAGSDRAGFALITVPVNEVIGVTLGARASGGSAPTSGIADGTSNTLLFGETTAANAALSVFPLPQLESISATPSVVTGGESFTIALNVTTATGAGVTVAPPTATAQLTSDRPNVIQLPATVTIPAHQLVPRAFVVAGTTSPVSTGHQTVTITVTLLGRSESTTLVIRKR